MNDLYTFTGEEQYETAIITGAKPTHPNPYKTVA